MEYKIFQDDIIEALKSIEDDTYHGVLSDPPYALKSNNKSKSGFMGKKWDAEIPSVEIWKEIMRVCKPGAYLLSFGGCYDEGTEVLTRRGWISFSEIAMGDDIASLNLETKLVEFQHPKKIISFEYDGPMHHYFNNRIDLCVTPDHKMLIAPLNTLNWKLISSRDVVASSRVLKTSNGLANTNNSFVLLGVKKGKGHGCYEQMPDVCIPTEIWAAFLGFWFAEGHATTICGKRGGASTHVAITHFNKKNMLEMAEMMRPYFNVRLYSGRLRINDPRLYEHFKLFGKASTKQLPSYVKFWSPNLLRILLDWYGRGDGDKEGRLYTSSKMLADNIQEIAMYAGLAADISIRTSRDSMINGRIIHSNYPQYIVRLLTKQIRPQIYNRKNKSLSRSIVSSIEWGKRKVFCVELSQHHTLYVRRNGKAVWCGNSRTHHRLMCNIEDAGLEIIDVLAWIQGQGFPKSLDVSKAIDEMKGKQRKVVGSKIGLPGYSDKGEKDKSGYGGGWKSPKKECEISAPATPEAEQWSGYGTALKPAWEPIILCRKNHEGTIAQNVLKYGCGALNIDGCRIPVGPKIGPSSLGRFPANLIHDGSEEVLEIFPNSKSGSSNGNAKIGVRGKIIPFRRGKLISRTDNGSASRFFYCAKAPTSERGEGNSHPAVKPLSLCEYLAKLLLPSGKDRKILVPYSGSGSEMIGAMRAGWDWVNGIEKEQEYCDIAKKRLEKETQGKLF